MWNNVYLRVATTFQISCLKVTPVFIGSNILFFGQVLHNVDAPVLYRADSGGAAALPKRANHLRPLPVVKDPAIRIRAQAAQGDQPVLRPPGHRIRLLRLPRRAHHPRRLRVLQPGSGHRMRAILAPAAVGHGFITDIALVDGFKLQRKLLHLLSGRAHVSSGAVQDLWRQE